MKLTPGQIYQIQHKNNGNQITKHLALSLELVLASLVNCETNEVRVASRI